MGEDEYNELILDNMGFNKPIPQYEQVIAVTIYHFYITSEIKENVEPYLDMINILKTAEAHDQIYIYINSVGGALSTTVQITAAMKQAQAHVVTVMEGEVCSAATFIFLSGDDYVVHDNCLFMIHNYSHGVIGKGKEVASRVKFSDIYFKTLANSYYTDFLTPEEIEDVCEDKDLWMGSDEVIERLKARGANVDTEIHDEYIFEDEPVKPKAKAKVKPKAKAPKKPKK